MSSILPITDLVTDTYDLGVSSLPSVFSSVCASLVAFFCCCKLIKCLEGRNRVRSVGVMVVDVVGDDGVEFSDGYLVTVWPFCFCVRRDLPFGLEMVVLCCCVGEFWEKILVVRDVFTLLLRLTRVGGGVVDVEDVVVLPAEVVVSCDAAAFRSSCLTILTTFWSCSPSSFCFGSLELLS